MSRTYPLNCWYVAALGSELGPRLHPVTILDTPVVLRRLSTGSVIALEDRCAHRGYPLSLGHTDGDRVVCGYHGFCFDTTGACVDVPSQDNPPYGTGVRAFPVREEGPYVWIWPGDTGRAGLQAPPRLPWLTGDGWEVSGEPCVVDVAANYLLIHDHYLDLTHVPVMHPEMLPPGLQQLAQIDDVSVSEMSVSLSRSLPPAPLAGWETVVTGLPDTGDYLRQHHGDFLSPAVVVERWGIHPGGGPLAEQVRVQAVTPVDDGHTRMFWHVARNFELGSEEVGERQHRILGMLMREDVAVIERIQAGRNGPASGLRVSADAAMLKARQIVAAMLRRETDRSPMGIRAERAG